MMSMTKMCSAMLAMLLLSAARSANADDAWAFAGPFSRSFVAPDACEASTDCNYQCSESYEITVSGSSLTIEPTSTPTASDCTCSTLSATVSGTTASGTLGSSISYDLELTSAGITVETTIDGTTCKGTYLSQAASFIGSYARTSVSPASCNVSTDCNYQCSASYDITVSGSSLSIKPTSTPTGCTCYTLSAATSGFTASGTYGNTLSYDVKLEDSGITVDTTIDGTTCQGTYEKSSSSSSDSASTSSGTSTPSPTTATTTSSAWKYSGADLLGLAMTGMAIYYQG